MHVLPINVVKRPCCGEIYMYTDKCFCHLRLPSVFTSRDCGDARALNLNARMSRHFPRFLMSIVHQPTIQLFCKRTVLTEHLTNDGRPIMTFNQRVRMQPWKKQGRRNFRTQLRKYRAIKYAYVCLSHRLCSGLNIPHRILLLIRVLLVRALATQCLTE